MNEYIITLATVLFLRVNLRYLMLNHVLIIQILFLSTMYLNPGSDVVLSSPVSMLLVPNDMWLLVD